MFNFGAITQWVAQSRALGASLGQIARELLGIGPRAIAPTREPMPRSRPVAPGRRPPRPPPRSPVSVPDDDLPPPEPPQRGGQPPSGGDDRPLDQRRLRETTDDEVFTPESSNVYSFWYDSATSELFVRFKAHEHVETSRKKDRGQSLGKRLGNQQVYGGNVGRKTNEPGATYKYRKVPRNVFLQMKLAKSKGTFVWDKLRVRGTIYGHQYDYSLVGAQVSPNSGETYIPRRASREGFKTRALADGGLGARGARGYRTSTLPSTTPTGQRLGFSNQTRGYNRRRGDK